MVWQKGQSGNPGGRLPMDEQTRALKLAARDMSADALATLKDIMLDTDAPPAARVTAAKEILDRGLGKAVQEVVQTVQDEHGDPVSQAELVARALERIMWPTGSGTSSRPN